MERTWVAASCIPTPGFDAAARRTWADRMLDLALSMLCVEAAATPAGALGTRMGAGRWSRPSFLTVIFFSG